MRSRFLLTTTIYLIIFLIIFALVYLFKDRLLFY